MMYQAKSENAELRSRRLRVYVLLQDGLWHKTAEINSAECGGTEGTRRLRELRAKAAQMGGRIEKRKAAQGTQFEYRWVVVGAYNPAGRG